MKKKHKKWMLLLITIFLVIGGAYFTTTSAYKLLAGYAIFQWNKQVVKKEVQPKETVAATEEKKQVTKVVYSVRPEIGELMGEFYIPKLESSLPIYHGTDEDELERGVGHYADSVLPGEKNNSVLSGHRDTVFRRLGEVGVGDKLVTTTTAGTFTYEVKRVRIVDSDDRTVIVPKAKTTLTVTTCYPFNYIGDAPERYILIAELVEKDVTQVFVAAE